MSILLRRLIQWVASVMQALLNSGLIYQCSSWENQWWEQKHQKEGFDYFIRPSRFAVQPKFKNGRESFWTITVHIRLYRELIRLYKRTDKALQTTDKALQTTDNALQITDKALQELITLYADTSSSVYFVWYCLCSNIFVTFSQTPQELYADYQERLNKSGFSENSFASYGYDAAWTCALTLNASIDILEKQNFNLTEFNYSRPNVSKVFVDIMKGISFAGMTVSYTKSW